MSVRLLSRPVPGVPDVRRSARWPDGALLVPPAAALAIMLWGLNGPSYWRDEADTANLRKPRKTIQCRMQDDNSASPGELGQDGMVVDRPKPPTRFPHLRSGAPRGGVVQSGVFLEM